jgi:HAD superfamily hydrolase (TIGR01509 family)
LVDGERAFHAVGGLPVAGERRAGVVDQDVDGADGLPQPVSQVPHGGAVGEVGVDRRDRRPYRPRAVAWSSSASCGDHPAHRRCPGRSPARVDRIDAEPATDRAGLAVLFCDRGGCTPINDSTDEVLTRVGLARYQAKKRKQIGVPSLAAAGCRYADRLSRPSMRTSRRVKKYILFDHDGVLVDTEFWYFEAGERALADIGFTLDEEQYLRDMNQGAGTWLQARAAGVDEAAIDRQRAVRDVYYQEYLRTEAIEIDGVVDTLAELSQHVRMAIVTTAKRADFDIIHEGRQIRRFMDFVLVREDYNLAKPHPEPYLTGLKRFGATRAQTLVVEDSQRGLNSAVAAGIDCAVVHNEFTRTHDFSQATFRIKTLAELTAIVRQAD